MTDLTPNDLSHMSDEDFNALCPQGHHALGAEPLSPAAQAILDAICITTEPDCSTEHLVAAALRAVADQVVPPEQERLFNEERPWDVELCSVVDVRLQLLAIAAELEAR